MAIWAIVPAAGSGTRMMSTTPKQYLVVNGEAVIVHALRRLAAVGSIRRIVVALHPQDSQWASLGLPESERLGTCIGGADRSQSVLNGLLALRDLANEDDYVLVHDAVRPCVRSALIEQLLEQISQHPVGGLLAVPVNSTLKKAGPDGKVIATLDRRDVWAAGTPQAFRYGLLQRALTAAIGSGAQVTDEASALEMAGLAPVLVRDSADNIKITYPEDLVLAGLILDAQESG